MAASPIAHIARTATNPIMIRNGGMFETAFSLDGWKSIALIFTVLGWTLGAFVIVSGIIVYIAKTNIEVLKESPRRVVDAPAMKSTEEPTIPITVIAFGYGEPSAYADAIIDGLRNAGFTVRKMTVGFRSDAPTGLTVVSNGHNATALMKSLDQATLKYSIGETHHIPASATTSASDSIVLEVGAK
jgi:hypothetical protein